MMSRSEKLVWHKLAVRADIPNGNYFRVLMCVFDYSGPTGLRAHPGSQRLAEDCRVSVDTVDRALKWLVQHGWLRRRVLDDGRIQRGGRARNGAHWATEYELSTPVGVPNPLDDVKARNTSDDVRYDVYGNPCVAPENDPWATPRIGERTA